MATQRTYVVVSVRRDTRERIDKLKAEVGANTYDEAIKYLLDFYEKNKGSNKSNNISNSEIEKKFSDIYDHITKIYTMLYLLTIAVTLLSNNKK